MTDRPPTGDGGPQTLAHSLTEAHTQRLRELSHDFDVYSMTIVDPEWRREMWRAVVMEMQIELEHLADAAREPDRSQAANRPRRWRLVRWH